eukprot:m.96126 g.96126  ORF g.96126 m.96126 type:complete len:579 (-) comp15177_c0_seq4:85-1821(-)
MCVCREESYRESRRAIFAFAGSRAKNAASILAAPAVIYWSSPMAAEGGAEAGLAATTVEAPKQEAPPAAVPAVPVVRNADLTWDDTHTKNEENIYCYCQTGWDDRETWVHCDHCHNWFHRKCCSEDINEPLSQLMRRAINYQFICKVCKPSGELLLPHDCSHGAASVPVLAELAEVAGDPGKHFHLSQEIIPKIVENWAALHLNKPNNMETKRLVFLIKDYFSRYPQVFQAEEDDAERFRLLVPLQGLVPDMVPNKNKTWQPDNGKASSKPSSKRRTEEVTKARKSKRSREDSDMPNSASVLFNKDGFRYTRAERDPLTPSGFRPARSNAGVRLSAQDRATQLKLSDNMMTVTGDKGYCMLRATHGVTWGRWYYEVEILPAEPPSLPEPPEAHTRIGWSQKHGQLQGPCGYDCFSYSWRDVEGTKFHVSKGKAYGEPYGVGDVLGFMIDLPVPTDNSKILQRRNRLELPFDYKGSVWYERKDNFDKRSLKPLPNSSMTCFKNGVSQGRMFSNVFEGQYYPAVSLYMGAKVHVRFSDFKFPPPAELQCRPFDDAVYVNNAAMTLDDLTHKIEQMLSGSS